MAGPSIREPAEGHEPELLRSSTDGWHLRCGCDELGPDGQGLPVPGANRAERRTNASYLYRRHLADQDALALD